MPEDTMTRSPISSNAPITARRGVWTPWAQVLCIECDHKVLTTTERGRTYARHLDTIDKLDRAELVEADEYEALAKCDECRAVCWVRFDVGMLQSVMFRASDLDWEGPWGAELEQTGGMCAALVFSTADNRKVVVTAMEGQFSVGEYLDECWDDEVRTWEGPSFYSDEDGQVGYRVGEAVLAALADECARKVIELINTPKEMSK